MWSDFRMAVLKPNDQCSTEHLHLSRLLNSKFHPDETENDFATGNSHASIPASKLPDTSLLKHRNELVDVQGWSFQGFQSSDSLENRILEVILPVLRQCLMGQWDTFFSQSLQPEGPGLENLLPLLFNTGSIFFWSQQIWITLTDSMDTADTTEEQCNKGE